MIIIVVPRGGGSVPTNSLLTRTRRTVRAGRNNVVRNVKMGRNVI